MNAGGCGGDATLTKALWRFLQPDGYSRSAMELEHQVAAICNRITADGIPFDRDTAEHLCEQWETRRDTLEAQLRQQFPEIDPGSRAQIGRMLEARGWVPEERTEKKREPVVSDEVLETLPEMYPDLTGFAEYHTLLRRLGQLASGKQAWLQHVKPDGRIHGGLIHCGTPHSRAKHLQPNIAQVPNPKRGKPLAVECRALFRANDDWVFVTCDQSNLQDRGFAHYLAEFDGGAYGRAFLAGTDTHWASVLALGLIPTGTERDKDSKVHTALREGAKRFRYGFLFGAGAKRAGELIADIARDIRRLDSTSGLHRQFFGSDAHPSENAIKRVGGGARRQFMTATPGLQRLRQSLDAQHERHEWVLGLDGRRVPTGAQYKALNRIVTASEAVICKRWLVRVYDELRERFRYGWDGDVVIVAWVHDELVACCRPEIAEQVGELMVRHAKEPGEFYGFKVPLDAEYKIGRSWAGEPVEGAAEQTNSPTGADADKLDAHSGAGGDNVGELELELDASESDDCRVDDFEAGDAGFASTVEPVAESAGSTGELAAILNPVEDLQDHLDGVGDRQDLDGDDEGAQTDPHADAQDGVGDSGEAELGHPNGGAPAAGDGAARNGDGRKRYNGSSGGNFHCPFHDDPTPSLHVYNGEDDPHYHCFGCGAHGPLSDLPGDWAEAAAITPQSGDEAETLAYAHRLFEQARPISSTLAERYLREIRGVDTDALSPDLERSLRFHPCCPFNGGRHPCLLALFRDVETDAPAGIHRIALTAEAQKIERRMLGRWSRPRAIKLWPAGGRLFLGEGIETVLTAATRLRDRGVPMQPAWAAGSAGNVDKFPLVAGVEELTLLVDHGTAGKSAAASCYRAWKTAGRTIRCLLTHDEALNDFNDLVREKLRTPP